jgi:hypothetical protein
VITPPPVTAEEKEMIAALDEPEKTPEEIAEEKKALKKAEDEAREARLAGLDTESIEVDLKKDFKEFCRSGKRTARGQRWAVRARGLP